MANRRSGGMGGPRGNRGFSQPSYQGSPWQGQQNSQGLMSQISNPHQLALALSNLLQTQHNNPPSLLSLNTSGFSNQDRGFGYGNRSRDMRRVEPYSKVCYFLYQIC